MDALVLTQWEYQDQDGTSQGSDDDTVGAQAAEAYRKDLSGIFFTSEGYDHGHGKGYESSGEQRKRLAASKANLITALANVEAGQHNIICFVLDSQLATLKLQLLLVGDESKRPLRIKLCGPSFAKKARAGGAWRIGSILFIRHLRVCKGSNGALEGVLKGWDEAEQVVVLKQLSTELTSLGRVDFPRMRQLCIPGEVCEEVVLPKCEKIFAWVRKEKMALLRFASRGISKVETKLHFRSLAGLSHADVVTLAGKPVSSKLGFFPTKAGMRERPFFTLKMVDGGSLVVVLSSRLWDGQQMKRVCEEVEEMLKGGGFVFCIQFKTGWCFPEDKVKLVPTRESQILSYDAVRRQQPHLLEHFIVPAQEGEGRRKKRKLSGLETHSFGSVKALISGLRDPGEFFAEVPAFIAATKGIPKAQLRCRSCGGACVVTNNVHGCGKKCVWGGQTQSTGRENREFEQSVSSIVLSPGLPDFEYDFVVKSSHERAGGGNPPVGFAWKVSPFYAILSDTSSLSAGGEEKSNVIVLVGDVGLKELIAVDPYQLHLDESSVAYRKILTHEDNAKFKYLLQVHRKEDNAGVEERKITLVAVDLIA